MDNSLRTIDKTITGVLLTEEKKLKNNLIHKEHILNNKKIITTKILKKSECKNIIKNIKKFGLNELNTYPKEQRQSERLCIIDDNLSELIYKRIKGLLEVKFTNIIPFGINISGEWTLLGINNCFRAVSYKSPSIGFKYHYDSPYCKSSEERSILSLVIYLNQNFEGGTTNFYNKNDLVNISDLTTDEEIKLNGGINTYNKIIIKPFIGKCVIFEHNTLHMAEPLTKGTKYVLRTDVIYKRKAGIVSYPTIFEENKYHRTINYFRHAQHLELNGDNKKSSELYERSLSVRKCTNVGTDIWLCILNFCNTDMISIMFHINKQFNIMIKNASNLQKFWNKMYNKLHWLKD